MTSFTNKCMLCLVHNKNLKNVSSGDYEEVEEKLKYAMPEENITSCYNKIVNSKSQSAKYVCFDCLDELNHIYKFKQKCFKNLKSLSDNLEEAASEENLESSEENLESTDQQNCEIENIVIKIEPQDIQDNSESDNLEEHPHRNNLAEVVVKGEPEVFHYDFDIRQDPLVPVNITYNGTTDNTGYDTITDGDDTTRPYKCEDCHKSFKRANHLMRHRLVHSGEKPFQCDICARTFRNKHHLITHKYTHTSDKTVKCDFCDKVFKNKYYLVTHRRLHTGERPFQCDLCDKEFIYKASLVIHKRAHTGERPYECDVCDKAFASQSHLIEHNRTHTGEKPYKCDMCDKAFSHTKSLKTHKQAHTGVKPYECGVCPYRCTTSANLKSHVQRRHGNEKQ